MTVSLDVRARARALSDTGYTGVPATTIVVAATCVHLVAAALMYRDLVTDLYALLAAAPQLSVMARGLTRLLAATVFLPPILPTLLLVGTTLRLRSATPRPQVAQPLALGCVALAVDGALRAAAVLVAPPPSNLGDALDLQNRLAPGGRTIAHIVGIEPGPVAGYWLAILTLGAVGTVVAVARAFYDDARERSAPAGRRRRRRDADGVIAFQAACLAIGAYLLLGALGRVALPVATQLFLKLFG